jgi:SAM-dependent methyltransferase
LGLMRLSFPAYLDGLMAAYRSGWAGRDIHLGYWDDPPGLTVSCAPGEFRGAQTRLTERVLDLVPVRPGDRVLDVACGIGGTLSQLTKRCLRSSLTGLNIDPRQLELCRDIAPTGGGMLALIAADGCALPFAAAVFDHVLCIEAMFHFRSRHVFFAEAARVLRRDGTLVITDILLSRSRMSAPWDDAAIETALRRDYGPWPDPWGAATALEEAAAAAGFELVTGQDWTRETLPSYRIIAPGDGPLPREHPDAGTVLRWLHEAGRLIYPAMMFQRL